MVSKGLADGIGSLAAAVAASAQQEFESSRCGELRGCAEASVVGVILRQHTLLGLVQQRFRQFFGLAGLGESASTMREA